jgi:hypothetical protein
LRFLGLKLLRKEVKNLRRRKKKQRKHMEKG